MSLYHGLTIKDAVLYIAARSRGEYVPTQATIRSWVNRGQVHKTTDGQIDPHTLEEWWAYQRDTRKARVRSVA